MFLFCSMGQQTSHRSLEKWRRQGIKDKTGRPLIARRICFPARRDQTKLQLPSTTFCFQQDTVAAPPLCATDLKICKTCERLILYLWASSRGTIFSLRDSMSAWKAHACFFTFSKGLAILRSEAAACSSCPAHLQRCYRLFENCFIQPFFLLFRQRRGNEAQAVCKILRQFNPQFWKP